MTSRSPEPVETRRPRRPHRPRRRSVEVEAGQARAEDRVTVSHDALPPWARSVPEIVGDAAAPPPDHGDDVVGRVGDRQREEAHWCTGRGGPGPAALGASDPAAAVFAGEVDVERDDIGVAGRGGEGAMAASTSPASPTMSTASPKPVRTRPDHTVVVDGDQAGAVAVFMGHLQKVCRPGAGGRATSLPSSRRRTRADHRARHRPGRLSQRPMPVNGRHVVEVESRSRGPGQKASTPVGPTSAHRHRRGAMPDRVEQRSRRPRRRLEPFVQRPVASGDDLDQYTTCASSISPRPRCSAGQAGGCARQGRCASIPGPNFTLLGPGQPLHPAPRRCSGSAPGSAGPSRRCAATSACSVARTHGLLALEPPQETDHRARR